MAEQPNAAITIGILGGGDPVVGPLLESLLASAGYGVRLLGEEPEGSLSECGLLMFAPGLSFARRQAFLLGGAEDDSRVPILELVKSLDGVEARAVEYQAQSPLLEELKLGIEAALLGAAHPPRKEERREAARR